MGFPTAGRAFSFGVAGCPSAFEEVVLPSTGALATVKGFFTARTRDVLLKPSASNPCVISSASTLDLLLGVAGPFAFADLSLAGALVLDVWIV